MTDRAATTVLYRDADVVAVFKPEGVAAVGETRDDAACLAARLARDLGAPVWPVHRLDKDVSGVMLFALTASAHRFLNRAFELRRVVKTYLAVVHGAVKPEDDAIELPVREFGSGRMGVDEKRGKPSQTAFRVLDRGREYTLLEVRPLTGRRHQIRVHLYHIGHPIAGDRRYGHLKPASTPCSRLMLHASGIALDLPSGPRLELRDVPSPTFEAERERLGLAGPGASVGSLPHSITGCPASGTRSTCGAASAG